LITGYILAFRATNMLPKICALIGFIINNIYLIY
jgi:hypothetical protein